MESQVLLPIRYRSLTADSIRLFAVSVSTVKHIVICGRAPKLEQLERHCRITRTTEATSKLFAASDIGIRQFDAAGGLLMITSTREFCRRPISDSFPATGELSPLPNAMMRLG